MKVAWKPADRPILAAYRVASRGVRSPLALLLTVVAAGLAAQSAAASVQANTGVLAMAPAQRTLVARPPIRLAPTRVSNSTAETMHVTVFPAVLTQRRDGAFDFRRGARGLLAVGPARFTLRPHRSALVRLRWLRVPRAAKEADLALVVQGTAARSGQHLRLLGMNFFALPGNWIVSGRITGLRGQQVARHVVRFLANVQNTGQLRAAPRDGRCQVRRRSGAVVARDLPYRESSAVVLPGFAREYPVVIKRPHVLSAGSYVLRCSQRFGNTLSTRSIRFRLTAANALGAAPPRAETGARANQGGSSSGGAWWLLLGVPLAILLGAWLLVRRRRERRAIEAEQARTRAGYVPEPLPRLREGESPPER